jgi:hypothetical protein
LQNNIRNSFILKKTLQKNIPNGFILNGGLQNNILNCFIFNMRTLQNNIHIDCKTISLMGVCKTIFHIILFLIWSLQNNILHSFIFNMRTLQNNIPDGGLQNNIHTILFCNIMDESI